MGTPIDELLDSLKNGSPQVRREAAKALGDAGEGRAVQALIGALKDPDEGVRAAAVWALGEIGDKSALGALRDALLQEASDPVRREAHTAWRKLTGTAFSREATAPTPSESGAMGGLAGAADSSEIILEAAQPDVYRRNAFRVAELATDATVRDLNRRHQIVEMARKAGLPIPPGPGRALPLGDSTDGDVLGEALQHLREPERRLVDEFFWFWPQQLGQSQNDEALRKLGQGAVQDATDIWLRYETRTETFVSKHNLAVLSHALALDLEHAALARELTADEKSRRDEYWRLAFKRWKVLLDQEGFWSRLTARIRDLDDVRLTTGTARRIRSSLPVALLGINAQLAVQAAERGNDREASRQMQIIQQVSGFEQSAIDEAVRRACQPIRDRIKRMCDAAEAEAAAHPADADDVSDQLFTGTKPLLRVLDCLLPSTQPTRVAMHDQVAASMLICQVAFGKATENWDRSLELLKLALTVVAGEAARQRIEENIRIVENNLRWGTCWFCERQPADDDAAIEVKMFGNVTRTPTWGGTQIQWSRIAIKVPRCANCKYAHAKAGTQAALTFLAGIAASIFGCLVLSSLHGLAVILLLIGIIVMVIGVVSASPGGGVKRESEKTKFPVIQEHLRQGWQLGEKPSDAR